MKLWFDQTFKDIGKFAGAAPHSDYSTHFEAIAFWPIFVRVYRNVFRWVLNSFLLQKILILFTEWTGSYLIAFSLKGCRTFCCVHVHIFYHWEEYQPQVRCYCLPIVLSLHHSDSVISEWSFFVVDPNDQRAISACTLGTMTCNLHSSVYLITCGTTASRLSIYFWKLLLLYLRLICSFHGSFHSLFFDWSIWHLIQPSCYSQKTHS